jgi:hypothetical protein
MLSTCSRKLSQLDVCFELQSPYLDEKDVVLARFDLDWCDVSR